MWSLHVCVSFNHPYTTGESIQNRTQNRTTCVTHSPVTLSYILTRNPWQRSVRCYTPSSLTAVNDPKGKPTLYIHIYISCAKGISLNSALTSKWALFQHGAMKVWFCWLHHISGKKQQRGPAPSCVQSTGLAACKN